MLKRQGFIFFPKKGNTFRFLLLILQFVILIRLQTHLFAIVGHHIRTIGRLEITHGSIALRID